MNVHLQSIGNHQKDVNGDGRLTKFQPTNTTAFVIHAISKFLLTPTPLQA